LEAGKRGGVNAKTLARVGPARRLQGQFGQAAIASLAQTVSHCPRVRSQQYGSEPHTVVTQGLQLAFSATPVTQTLCAHVELPHIGLPQTLATSFTHVCPQVLLQHEDFAVQIMVTQGSHVLASFAPVEHRL
jgi:hypothetical protein